MKGRQVVGTALFSLCLSLTLPQGALARPRPAQPPLPGLYLNLWRFDGTNWWNVPATAPLAVQNISSVESWSDMAVAVAGEQPAWLRFPVVGESGRANITCDQGTVRFWFRPYWGSGSGPGSFARLLEMGVETPEAEFGWWCLYLNPEGTAIYFTAQGAGQTVDYLAVPVNWTAGAWHAVALTYSPSQTALYLDGQLRALGEGIRSCPPDEVMRALGFGLGSDLAGERRAMGEFDELATFGYPCSAEEVAWWYAATAPLAQLGPIGPEEDLARQQDLLDRQASLAALRVESGLETLSGGCTCPPGQTNLALAASVSDSTNLLLCLCNTSASAWYGILISTNLAGTNPPIRDLFALLPPGTTSFTVTNIVAYPNAFFRLREMPDTDGDGLPDSYPYSFGGLSFNLDTDDDNDGIPNSIEQAARSDPADPASLPPPSLYVSTNGPANGADGSLDLPYRDIQTALNQATNYSVIQVKPGLYTGVSNCNLSFGGKKLVLISEKGWENTVIGAADSANRGFVFTSGENWQSFVIGLTISSAGRSAVYCGSGSSPTFVNCQFTRNWGTNGAAFLCSNASPVILNCRFYTNTSTRSGGAVYGIGSNCWVRVSHCTFSDNRRGYTSGQLYATNKARLELNNCIVWSSFSDQGTEVGTNGGATATATYCDIRGAPIIGTGNINADPLFETNRTCRLTADSPCIDAGTTNSFAGFGLFTRYDMDGEARVTKLGGANTPGRADIGADEFVYRIRFRTVQATNWVLGTNGLYSAQTITVSELDEASGGCFLGTNVNGPLIAVVDDEDRDRFHILQLNTNATEVQADFATTILDESLSGDDREIHDLEGATFDSVSNVLYLVTSQTKRNRYRNVDTSPPIAEALVDPPSSDYDRRRNVLIRVQLDSTLTNATDRAYFESENVVVPDSVCYDAANGLIGYIRQTLGGNAAIGALTNGTKVMIAFNTANKFGSPSNSWLYATNQTLPYANGGLQTTAATVLAYCDFGTNIGTFTHPGLTSNRTYFYKIWAVDGQNNYWPGPTVGATNDGLPRLFINEFMALGAGDDWIELYNPAFARVSLSGLEISDHWGDFYRLPPTNVAPQGFVRLVANNESNGLNLSFRLDQDGEMIILRRTSDGRLIDWYGFGPQDANVTEGRAWDGGPRAFISTNQNCDGARFNPGSSYPPTQLGVTNPPTSNHPQPYKHFTATPHIKGTTNYLEWQDIGVLPATWRYSPKQHDFHPINIEDLAYRSQTEMVFGLRAPLSNRTTGNAYYYVVTNMGTFLTSPWPAANAMQGIGGPYQMNLDGLGFRSLKWCPHGLTNASGQEVARYLILAGSANGGPLQREKYRQKFSLYSWTGTNSSAPHKLIDDLAPYSTRPEGLDLMRVQGEWRLLLVEDRYLATGYGTRNAVHWPVGILGRVP